MRRYLVLLALFAVVALVISIASNSRTSYQNETRLRRIAEELGGSVAIGHYGQWPSVYLDNTRTSDEDVKRLFSTPSWVEDISLEGTDVTDASFVYLGRINDLEFLTLSRTAVTGRGIKYLSNLDHLRRLTLSETRMNSGGLCEFPVFPRLVVLDLDNTNVSDEGVLALASGCLPSIQGIFLENTDVSNCGLLGLMKIKSLRFVSVGGTKVTPEGIRLARERRPDIEFQ